MSGGGRSGIPAWLVGIGGYLLYRQGRRAGEGDAGRPDRAGRAGGAGRPAFLRDVTLPDGREALEVSASMFEPDPDDDEVWRRVHLEGTAACQEALELTLAELAPGAGQVEDVPVVLLPLGTRRRVNAVDAYATGGRIGHLSEHVVAAVGDSVRATQEALGQPCGVWGRIVREGTGVLAVDVLLPEVFAPGPGADGRR